MKAEELRIGNWVKEYHGGKYVQINHKDLSDIATGKYPVEPISVTTEILLKSGFENWDKSKYSNDTICLAENGEGFLFLVNQRHVNVFYLHQLQNLYYALTGVELSVS